MRYEQRVQRYILDSDINLKSRKQEHLYRRYYLMSFLKEKTSLSMASIGRIFRKDHSTVINAIRETKNLSSDANYYLYTESERDAFPMYLSYEFSTDNYVDPLLISKSLQYLETKIFKHG